MQWLVTRATPPAATRQMVRRELFGVDKPGQKDCEPIGDNRKGGGLYPKKCKPRMTNEVRESHPCNSTIT